MLFLYELEGLLPEASNDKKGLMPASMYMVDKQYSTSGMESGSFVKLFNIKQYGLGCFYLFAGNFTDNNSSTLFSGFVSINNRSQGAQNIHINALKFYGMVLYTKRNTDNSADVYVKMPSSPYLWCSLRWIALDNSYDYVTMHMEVDESISESELTKVEL